MGGLILAVAVDFELVILDFHQKPTYFKNTFEGSEIRDLILLLLLLLYLL